MPAAWAAGISAVGSLASAAIQSGSIDGAAGAANGISQAAIDRADANRTADRNNFQPFVDQGTGAVTSLGNLLGINGTGAASTSMADFKASPGYGYALDQGLRAVDAAGAARGMGRSGATLKAEQTLGNNLANQDFGAYMGRLSGLAGLGITGAQGQAGTTATFNSLLGGQTTNQASATYGAGVNDASIYGNAISGLTSGLKSSGGLNGLFNGTGGNSGASGFVTPATSGTGITTGSYNPTFGY